MTEKARAALVGLENPHSGGWLTTLQHCDAVGRLVVCLEEDGPEGVGSEVDHIYRSLDELIAAEELEFALVCTRNDRAAGWAGQLLEAGVSVIVEKPVARTAAEVARLNEIAAAKGLIWATAFMNRSHPIALKLRALIAEGVLGEIASIEGRMVTSTVQQRKPDHWLFNRALSGGGIAHWLGIHTIDMVRYVTGLEFNSVSAHMATLSGADIDVEDMFAASFAMDNGAIGHIHAGYVLPRRYGDLYLCVRGSEGDATWQWYDWDGKGDKLIVQSRAPGWTDEEYREFELSVGEAPGYGGASGLAFIADFIAASREQGTFITDGEDAYRALRFVEGAYAAAESGVRTELA